MSPVVLAFINQEPGKSTGLVDQIQQLTQRHADKGLRAFVVYEGGPELKLVIEQMTREHKITIPVVYLPDGKSSDSLKQYRINPAARNTILAYREKRVTATFSDVDDKSFARVADAAAAMLQ
jgi:hypothetical protein